MSDKSGDVWYQNAYCLFYFYLVVVSGMLRYSLATGMTSRGRQVCQVIRSLGLTSLGPLFITVHSMTDYSVLFSGQLKCYILCKYIYGESYKCYL